MSGPLWVQGEECRAKKLLQAPLNLYVHPEPSPESEERLLRHSGAHPLSLQYKSTDGAAASLESMPSGSLEPRKDYNYDVQPCLACSPSAAHRDSRVIALSTAGPSADSYDGQNSSLMGYPDSHSLQLSAGHAVLVDQAPVLAECNVTFRQHLPTDSAVAPLPPCPPSLPPIPQSTPFNQQTQNQHDSQHYHKHQPSQQQQQQQSGLSERPCPAQSTCLHTPDPDGGGAFPSLPGSFEPVQEAHVDYGSCKSPSTCHTRDVPAPGELVSVHSLSLSGPDRDLLDQLLGSEPGGVANSPPLATPSSFLAAGPFGDVALQPSFSDYSQRPTPATLTDQEAEADSATRQQVRQQMGAEDNAPGSNLDPKSHLPPLLGSYNAPLSFSALMPQHMALQPPCSSAVTTPCRTAATGVRGSNGNVSTESPAGSYAPLEYPGACTEAGVRQWGCGTQGHLRAEYESQQNAQQHQHQVQQQEQMQQQQEMQQQMQQEQMQQQQEMQQQMQQQEQMQHHVQHRQQQLYMHHHQQEMPRQQQMLHQQTQQSPAYQRPRSATQTSVYGVSHSMASLDTPDPLTAAHSAPVPGVQPRRDQATSLMSVGGAGSPMHVDGPLRAQSCMGFSASGATAASVQSIGSKMDVTPVSVPASASAANATSGGGGGYFMAPMLCSPADSRGKRLRQQPTDVQPVLTLPAGASMCAPPQTTTVIAAAAADASAGGAADVRSSSPSSRSQSAGDAMGVDSNAMYGQGAGYSYVYGMPPPYPISYGMPYGDPYYHPGYGYSPMMDTPPPQPAAGPDTLSYSAAVAHYPGCVLPRQRLYRRFANGQHARRDNCGPALETPSAAGAAGPGQDGIVQQLGHCPGPLTASGPCGSHTAGAAPSMRPNGTAGIQSATGPLAAMPPASPPPPRAASCGGTSSNPNLQGPVDQVSGGGGSHCQMILMQGGRVTGAPGGSSGVPGSGAVDMESSMAARACHEQFAADDMPLPLPRSTVDGIRQELRAVTQEFLQRRMDLARSKQIQAAAQAQVAHAHAAAVHAQAQAQGVAGSGAATQPRMRPANCWTAGDPLSSASIPTASGVAALNPLCPPYPQQSRHSVGAPGQGGDAYPHGTTGPSGVAPAAAAAGGGSSGGCGGGSMSLPHKRGAMGLSASGAVSPVRARPAPSAPVNTTTAHHTMPLPPIHGGGGGVGSATLRRGAEGLNGDLAPTVPMQMIAAAPGGMGASAPAPGPSAMRQLFPPPAGGGGGGGHPGGAVVAGNGATGGSTAVAAVTGKLPQAAATVPVAAPAASAPLGPRPAMSGKSSASATHSVSVAQTAPVRSAPQQQQLLPNGGGALVGVGSYRVGQQGSMAAEVEDDGEEVHGPPQRHSSTRGTMGQSTIVSPSICGPLPSSVSIPPNYYGNTVPPPPYDYPPGYYYPSSMGSYGMRMYGMPPPNMPQGYRPPPTSGMQMYGMPAQAMPYSNAGNAMTPSWPEFGTPLMQGTALSSQVGPGSVSSFPSGGLSSAMSGMHMRGGSTPGTGGVK
ncbi:hypothetical protein VaNZ11_013196 [Volvox africanus]|uniref:Uncharacterized protein n=1 Tax=Volvox africanus TaxID=51714 RepID=A0ABQ5SFK8_9CHLO|nr:hypothetical protein VaNZ11_013196 [Volvox africanus]